jgi:sulfur carrier protein ThiS
MRMHRGSSKDVPGISRAAETLPLSASASRTVSVVLELTRAGRVERRRVRVPVGSPLRTALHRVGASPEGSAVLLDDLPVPLDLPIDRPLRFTVVSTFSGG